MDIAGGTSSSFPSQFAQLGSRLVFQATDATHGEEPWITDGTTAGTHLLRDIDSGTASSLIGGGTFARVGSALVFAAADGTHGIELWRSDGTRPGTRLVSDIWPGPHESYPQDLTTVGGRVYFSARSPGHNSELWRYEP